MKNISLFFAVWMGFCFVPAVLYADTAFTIGAAKVKITPVVETFKDKNRNRRYDEGEPFNDLNGNGRWDPVWLAGYQTGRYATDVHDEIWARALVLSDGHETLLLIALDLIGYLFDEVGFVKAEIEKELGIPSSRILIASTHDHSGPDTVGLWGIDGKSGKNPDYLKWLRSQILECSRQAFQSGRPGKFVFGKVRYSNPIEDSRPPKVINDLLLSFRAVDEQNNTIATVVNYAMHAEVLNWKNRRITSDYPGVLRDRLEKHFGGVSLFFPADIGGMQSPFVFFHTFWSSRRVGKAIASKVIQSLKNRPPVSVPFMSVKTKKILLPIENPRFLASIEKGLFGESRNYVTQDGGKLSLPADVTVVQMGPAVFMTVPGELFPELGNDLRALAVQDYPFLIGLCNNEIGYIVPEEQWKNDGYEESMSLGPQTATILTESLSELLITQ